MDSSKISDWNDENNSRRCCLIGKEVEGSLNLKEKENLIYSHMLTYHRSVTLLPIKGLSSLYLELISEEIKKLLPLRYFQKNIEYRVTNGRGYIDYSSGEIKCNRLEDLRLHLSVLERLSETNDSRHHIRQDLLIVCSPLQEI